MTEYADPDLETIAPLPPAPPLPVVEPVPPHRGSAVGMIVALIVVSLVVGFGTATVVLNARDSSPNATVEPGPAPGPNSSVVDDLVVRQRDAPLGTVVLPLDRGNALTVATLDLCNGTYPSEKRRVARRQVVLVDQLGVSQLSTEAVLYGTPADGVQAFRELSSVVAQCPSNPVKSPVGADTTTTKFRAAPDGSWPHTPNVERLAFDFDSTDTSGNATHTMAIYLRRGRALVALYFPRPNSPQPAIEGRTTIAGIVALFEARLAQAPARAIGA